MDCYTYNPEECIACIFKHEVNPDGSTRTECLCVFPAENRKCQFVAVRDLGGHLRSETLEEHLRKHHNEVFKESDEREMAGLAEWGKKMKRK
ncbi:hypothetical protein DdX_12334 [Ditylenchus destructor]|uniref:Uncharacterized protein n=1 Tax=Ditylenchus destructor TaxID=166010 RepID=A0AAD4MZ94_9BILA|nr:hypothetical protein DdX_12334 [Ditylenchus destructor]